VSQTERLLILKMVAEKKISAEEAYELILALDASESEGTPVAPPQAKKIVIRQSSPLPIPSIPPIAMERSGNSLGFAGLSSFIEGVVDRVTSSLSDSVGSRHEFTTELTGRFEGDVIPVEVLTGNGPIDLQTSEGPECRVVITTKVSGSTEEEARHRAKDAYDVSIAPSGFTLKTMDDRFGGTAVSVTLYLPNDHRYRVDARTGNGRIQISKIAMSECNASTGNGRVEIAHGSADQVKARTGNGSIQINAEATILSAESGNGSVSVTPYGKGSQDLELATGNGSIHVSTSLLPREAGRRLDAKTVMGRIQVEIAEIKVEEESRGIGNRRFVGQSQGFASAAQQITIRARTSTGSVRVD